MLQISRNRSVRIFLVDALNLSNCSSWYPWVLKLLIKLQINNSDENDIKNTINRFETSCYTLSKNKMNAKCDIYEINTPLNELSYDEQFGYYVAPENVEAQIKETITNSDYDHIFVIVRLRGWRTRKWYWSKWLDRTSVQWITME